MVVRNVYSLFGIVAATQSACDPEEPHFLQSVEMYYDDAARLSDVSPGALGHIKAVDSLLRVTFPIETSDGKTDIIEGEFMLACWLVLLGHFD